jgi:uncharacterized membrane protein YfcA
VISSNGLLMLPILAALYLSLRSQLARLLLLLAAGAAALGAEVWMAEPAARLKAGLDLLLVIGLLAVCWSGCRLLPRASAHHHHRWLGALIVLLVLPLLTYKLLLAQQRELGEAAAETAKLEQFAAQIKQDVMSPEEKRIEFSTNLEAALARRG